MATESSTPAPLLFPAFLYGDMTTCRRKMKAEAKKWAKHYAEKGDFPEPKLMPVPPGSIIYTDDSAVGMMRSNQSTAHDPEWTKVAPRAGANVSRWHFYMLYRFWIEISDVLNHKHADLAPFKKAFEQFFCRYPWGALSVALAQQLFNTIPVVTRRVEALLSFWEQLDTLRYIELYKLAPIPIAELIADCFQGEVAMWVDQPTGNIRADLQTAVERMNRASEDEIRARLMRRLHALIDTERQLNHREWLKTPGVIEHELAAYASEGRELFEDLTSGYYGGLSGFLAVLDRKYPDG